MRSAAVIVAALIVATTAAGATSQPVLRIVRVTPSIVVRGAHFRPHERVRVTLARDTVLRKTAVRTSSIGTFTTGLGSLAHFDPCNDVFTVVVIGGPGEHATAKYIGRECPPAP